MTLDFTARLDARNLDVSLQLGTGQTLALMGPNGAGKSSVLAVLAGLLRADAGSALLAGRLLFSGGPGGTSLPPHRRGIGLLAQEPLLFPHLSVLDNVAFGPRNAGVSRAEARAAASDWLAAVDAAGLAGRRPVQLSGGQAQRVALARALATDPALLLLDEPLAALDIHSAPLIRRLLKRVLAGRRAIIVTHDVLDALLLADRVAILDGGRIVEEGPTAQLLARPRSSFAAGLAGLNVLPGTLIGNTLRDRLLTGDGETVIGRDVEPAAGTGTGGDPAIGARTADGVAAFSPSSVSVFLAPPHGSPRNCFRRVITELEPLGGAIRVRGGNLAADISPAAVAELALAPGVAVYFVVKAAEVAIYPA